VAKVLYGVLDEFGEVLRWQWDKPSSAYRFVIKRLKPLPPPPMPRSGRSAVLTGWRKT
jgi:hypothetical protein